MKNKIVKWVSENLLVGFVSWAVLLIIAFLLNLLANFFGIPLLDIVGGKLGLLASLNLGIIPALILIVVLLIIYGFALMLVYKGLKKMKWI